MKFPPSHKEISQPVYLCISEQLLPAAYNCALSIRLSLLPTEGVKNISNALTIGTDISAEHPELRSVAQAQGWWSGEGEFCFNEVFKSENPPARMELAKKRHSGGTQLLQQHDGEGDDSFYYILI